MKIRQFHRLVLVREVERGAHAKSKQEASQQEPWAEGNSDNKNQDTPSRKHGSHNATANGHAVDRDSGMSLQAFIFEPPFETQGTQAERKGKTKSKGSNHKGSGQECRLRPIFPNYWPWLWAMA